MTVALLPFITVALALYAPSPRPHRTRPALRPTMAVEWDTPKFLNDPLAYIAKNPSKFSSDLQRMVAYKNKVQNDELADWGDLPVALDQCASAASSLRSKSYDASMIAWIIAQADYQELQSFVQDAKFEEKKEFFQRLSALPEYDRGMLGIHEVASEMIQAGELPLISQFERDLQQVTSMVDSVNDALLEMDQKYSTLFLSVRKVTRLAAAAAEVAAWGESMPPMDVRQDAPRQGRPPMDRQGRPPMDGYY